MAGRPSKTLRELVQDGSFLARRESHRSLLASHDVPWPALAALQASFRAAGTEFEQRAIAREFQKLVAQAHAEAAAAAAAEKPAEPTLEESLDKLGPRYTARRLKKFFPRYLTLEDGEPFRLQRWENEFVDEAWKRVDDGSEYGRRQYKEITLGIPRGNGKTPFAAGALTLATLEAPPVAQVFQAAGSKEQARIGVDFATSWAGDERELAKWLRAKTTSLQLLGRRGHFTIVSADGRLAHGRKPSAAGVDEWWLYESAREEQVYVAFQTALDKNAEAFLLATTTAGYDKFSQLGQAYERAMRLDVEYRRQGFLRIARDVENGYLMWWYGLPDGMELDLENDKAVLRALKLANPSSFVPHEALLRALRRPTTDPYEWLRLHLNAWTEGRDMWLPMGCFAGLRSTEPIPAGAEIFVAVDAAVSYDTTAVVWAAMMPDGKVRLEGHAWTARAGAPAHERHPGGRINNRTVMEWIDRELGGKYKVKEIVADPKFFDDYIFELGERGYTAALFVQNSKEMREAEQHFYRSATGGEFSWYDPKGIMALHVNATSARATRTGFKVENPEKRKPIDLATAAIMALERCTLAGRAPKVAAPWAARW